MHQRRKTRPTWIFVAIEVWSRIWPSTVTGRRSYRNTLALLRNITYRMDVERLPLIVTDGFEFYERVVRRVIRLLADPLNVVRSPERNVDLIRPAVRCEAPSSGARSRKSQSD